MSNPIFPRCSRWLRANLAELRQREQSLTAQINAPARAATLRDSIRIDEERHGALGLDAEAHTARATEMRALLVEICGRSKC